MIFASKLSFTSVSKRFTVRNSSFEIKMRAGFIKMNMEEKHILIHMNDLARRVLTRFHQVTAIFSYRI